MKRFKTSFGALWALLASLIFSINDMLIKFLSDDYALHQIVFTRSLIAVLVMLVIVIPIAGGFSKLKTKRLGLHFLRALFVVAANLFFYMALADLPLATVVSIFFIAPFLITIFSVVFLNEIVGTWRWTAIFVGLLGVLLIVQPGTDAFTLTSILPAMAALCYALFHILTRKIGPGENLVTLTFYVPLVFLVITMLIGFLVGHGQFSGGGHRSVEFLVRAWKWPAWIDLGIMVFIGLGVAIGGAAISQAYRIAEAAFVAPFEYTSLIYATAFGYLLFSEWPDLYGWSGMGLVLISGLVMVWREAVNVQPRVAPPNSPR